MAKLHVNVTVKKKKKQTNNNKEKKRECSSNSKACTMTRLSDNNAALTGLWILAQTPLSAHHETKLKTSYSFQNEKLGLQLI